MINNSNDIPFVYKRLALNSRAMISNSIECIGTTAIVVVDDVQRLVDSLLLTMGDMLRMC